MTTGSHFPLVTRRRSKFLSAGLAWRIPLALLISLLIMMIFFATSASSH